MRQEIHASSVSARLGRGGGKVGVRSQLGLSMAGIVEHVGASFRMRVDFYEGGVLKAPQAWKHRVKQWGSFPFRTSRSFLGCSASLERMCWM